MSNHCEVVVKTDLPIVAIEAEGPVQSSSAFHSPVDDDEETTVIVDPLPGISSGTFQQEVCIKASSYIKDTRDDDFLNADEINISSSTSHQQNVLPLIHRVVPKRIHHIGIVEENETHEELLTTIAEDDDELKSPSSLEAPTSPITPSESKDQSMAKGEQRAAQSQVPKRHLERRLFRRIIWRSADSARSIGGALASLGMTSAHYRLLRSLTEVGGILRRLPQRKEAICGVTCRIYWPMQQKLTTTTKKNAPVSPLLREHDSKLPVIVYFHGGGWCIGSTKSYHPFTLKLCRDTGAIVVSVEYRLAPEHPYPAPADDCLAVTRAILNGDKVPSAIGSLAGEIDVNRVVVAGDSAGGNLSGVVALELIRLGHVPRLKGVLMVCPVTQVITQDHPSSVKYGPRYSKEAFGFFVSLYAGVAPTKDITDAIKRGQHVAPEQRQRYWKYVMPQIVESPESPISPTSFTSSGSESPIFCYSPQDAEKRFLCSSPTSEYSLKNAPLTPPTSPVLERIGELATTIRAWPLLADDEHLAQMPPTMVQTCSHDALQDENVIFYERLKHSGAVDVRHSHVERSEHCESVMNAMTIGSSKAGRQGYLELLEFLREILYNDNNNTTQQAETTIQEQNENDEQVMDEAAAKRS